MKKKSPSRLSVETSKETLEKFALLCKMKNLTQKEIINNWVNQFINKHWTEKINNLYKEIKL